MKIAYLLFSVQHPTLPGSARHYYFLRELSTKHRITLLALSRTEVADPILRELQDYCEACHFFLTHAKPPRQWTKWGWLGRRMFKLVSFRRAVSQMKNTLADLLREQPFDLVLIHGKNLVRVVEDVGKVPIVSDFSDAASSRLRQSLQYASISQRLLLYIKLRNVRGLERAILRKTPYNIFISLNDAQQVVGRNGRACVIPNGVDLDFWRRGANQRQPNHLLLTGVMSYAPNHDAAVFLISRILPQLRKRGLVVKVIIAGKSPLPELLALAQRWPEVTVTGYVEDIRFYYEQAGIFVAPLRFASGMQNKLLEAMAMELPVVTTRVAASGLRLRENGELPLLIAEDEEAFGQRIQQLLENPVQSSELAGRGRRYVEQHFDWQRGAEEFDKLFQKAVSQWQAEPNGSEGS